MNNITDDQLRALLAEMLPETITQHACGKYYWIGSANGFVLDTELLALCSLVEAGLTDSEINDYCNLWNSLRERIFATWKEITTKLAEVKGATP